jgi:hypothetical protein
MKSFTRFKKAFSNRFENRRHALALYFVFYNFRRADKALGVSPLVSRPS